MDGNPWAVSDASVFLKYCCPECNFQNEALHDFVNHAKTNHDLSKTLFGHQETKSEFKLEEEDSSHLLDPDWKDPAAEDLEDLLDQEQILDFAEAVKKVQKVEQDSDDFLEFQEIHDSEDLQGKQ